MRFVLEVDMDSFGDRAADELGRILRYWAGAMKQVELVPGAGTGIYDSTYQQVGQWRIEGSDASAAGGVGGDALGQVDRDH